MLFCTGRYVRPAGVASKRVFAFPQIQGTDVNDREHDNCNNHPEYGFHCTLRHRGFAANGVEIQLGRLDAVRHQNTMTAIVVIANKITATGMPLAISLRSARVSILPVFSLIEATELFRSVCIADLGRGDS